MNLLDRLIAPFAPEAALRRLRARTALRVLANYDAATSGNRGSSWWRARGTDADAAAARRSQLRNVSRDMIRNTPLAARGQAVIVSNVVGDGIIWKIAARSSVLRRQLQDLAERHLDTTTVDADGRANLYGLQRLALNATVDAGEVLIRRRRRRPEDRLPLPFQLQLLEADYLDTTKDWATSEGSIREGIEYDAIGRRVAYWLFDEHPGTSGYRRGGPVSSRVAASEVIHLYRQDRPGQRRGVTWFAPVAMNLQDLADGLDAHLVRQKVAACFAGFIVDLDGETSTAGMTSETAQAERLERIQAGRLQRLAPGQDIRFPTPPGVDGFDEFGRMVLRMVAAGLGITYEALTGDLSTVNFSSARMGRAEMNRNVSGWQHLMMVPQMMDPVAEWFLEAAAIQLGRVMPADVRMTWTAPTPIMVDPQREIAAQAEAVAGGFKSRQQVIREMGFDPDRVREEMREDLVAEEGLSFVPPGRGPRAMPGEETTDAGENGNE